MAARLPAGEPPPELQAEWDALEAAGALLDDIIVADNPSGRARLHAAYEYLSSGAAFQITAAAIGCGASARIPSPTGSITGTGA